MCDCEECAGAFKALKAEKVYSSKLRANLLGFALMLRDGVFDGQYADDVRKAALRDIDLLLDFPPGLGVQERDKGHG